MQKTSTQKIFNNQYAVVKKLSSGSFGVVFLGMDQKNNTEVAIKIEKEENEEVMSLEREIQLLKKLEGTDGVPRMLWAGQDQGYNICVIQLLGRDLAYYLKNLKRFSFKTVLTIGIQMVNILERVHQKGVVHRDLKPENIMLGTGANINKIYLIDFGISKSFRDSQNRHIPPQEGKSFLGTTRYASIAAHKGLELGRKDDIESLMYILLFFLRGQFYILSRQLPWQNMPNVTDENRTEKVGELKQQIQNDLFKESFEFQRIYDYVRKLGFKNEPDYKLIVNEFKKSAESQKIQLDGHLEWNEIRQSIHTTQTDTQKPSNSNEMKKSIEKQLSGLQLMGSQNHLLAPPGFSSRNNINSREDIRRSSRVTQLSQQNSILPKYNISRGSYLHIHQDEDCDLNQDEITENASLYEKYQYKSFKTHFFPKCHSNL